MNFLFVQLPVPSFVPLQNAGNHLLASSSIILHAQHCGIQGHTFTVLPQEQSTRFGDKHLVDTLCVNTPDVIAFTCTVWNIERTLYIAEKIKALLPHVKIWLGGPEISQDSWFLNDKNTVVDLAVEGEGEEIFRLLVSGADPVSLERVYIPGRTTGVSGNKVPLLSDLSTIHDPFINGYAELEPDRVMVTELFRGCRYRCSFCKYHSESNKTQCSLRPHDQVKSLFKWAHDNQVKELFLLDPSFEQRPDIDSFLSLLEQINNPVIPVFAELRAEYVDQHFAEKLYRAGIRLVETGLQTLTPKALANVRRACSKDRFTSGIEHLKAADIQIRTDIMLGLPGDTLHDFMQTVEFIKKIDLGNSSQVFRTQVLPGTELRKRAQELGIVYEDRPPYQVVSTSDWPADELENAIAHVEDSLEISCAPEERPVFITCKNTPSVSQCFPDTSSVYAYSFDCTGETGRARLGSETFSQASFTVSLYCKFTDYTHINLIKNSVCNLIRNNPFSSSCIVLHILPLFPLNCIDIISEALCKYRYSEYLPRLFSTSYCKHGDRRLIVCLDMSDPSAYSQAWLDDIRSTCEIVWLSNSDSVDYSTAALYPHLDPVDYIQYTRFPATDTTVKNTHFKAIVNSEIAAQVIFGDCITQWEFSEFLETAATR